MACWLAEVVVVVVVMMMHVLLVVMVVIVVEAAIEWVVVPLPVSTLMEGHRD